jgi:hypothetical protein
MKILHKTNKYLAIQHNTFVNYGVSLNCRKVSEDIMTLTKK